MRAVLPTFLLALLGLQRPVGAEMRQFVVDSKNSELTYTVQTKLFIFANEQIVGRNRDVEGAVNFDPRTGATAWLAMDAGRFQSGVKSRDKNVSEILQVKRFPRIRFELSSVSGVDLKLPEGDGMATGLLLVRDRPVRLSIPVHYRLVGDRLELVGQVRTTFSSFGLDPPVLGLIVKRAPDELVLEARLVAKELLVARKSASRLAGGAE